MKKYKRILILLVLFCNIKIVNASVTADISVSTNNTIVGNNGTATLTINANGQHIGQIYGTFSCGALGDKDLNFVEMNNPPTSKTYTINWTAKNTGTYNCTVTGLEVGTVDPAEFKTPSVATKTITVVGKTSNNTNNNNNSNKQNNNNNKETTAEKKEYDSDNTLKSLEIENYKITPDFNKDTLEYKLEVDESVEKINVKATKNSEKAEIAGIGEKNLTPGENTIEVKVTAENGNEKTYKILVTVKDQHPITVTIDNKKYTIVKKNNNILEKPETYEEEIIKIKDQDVISYINKVTKVRLVILKDENNKPGFYIYNDHSKKYSKYKAVTIGNIILQLLTPPEKLKNFKKYEIDIKGEKVPFYKINEKDKVGLIYGTNIKTGNTTFYVYDTEEDSLNRYYNEEVKVVNNEMQELKSRTMFLLGVAAAITIISTMISIITTIKRRKRVINRR